MPSNLMCPDDAELLTIASGEPGSAGLREHLADCPRCRERIERIEVEVDLLRREAPWAAQAASTAPRIGSDPAPHEGESSASAE
jgi:hypothetical protein